MLINGLLSVLALPPELLWFLSQKIQLSKKACAAVVGKGLQLKDDAAAFAESVKEDAQDIVAEAKYNNQQAKKGEKA